MTSRGNTVSSSPGLASVQSPYPFADTVQRLKSAFDCHGIKVFAVIDQTAEAAAVGLTLAPTTLLIFGNPTAGTPLMAAQPLCGIDLPLKALVTESTPGEVRVSFNEARYVLKRHSLPAEFLEKLAPAERLILGALSN